MKLTSLLLFGILLQVSATSIGQHKVNIRQDKITFKELFDEIERQTGVITLFSNDEMDMNREVEITVHKGELEDLYNSILNGTNLDFRVVDGYVVIKPRDEEISEKIAETIAEKPQDEKTLTGKVVDSGTGEVLVGVNVYVRGTTIGTVTNEVGEFTLEVPTNAKVLVFSFIGFDRQEVEIGEKTAFNITLENEISGLDEVVVTGYQTISKERATGSFNIVPREQLEKPTTNIGSRLAGTVSGVQTTFDEEGNPTFEIRGQTSLFANSKPLVVVDGFAIEGDFESINPNDVESITVLKDAAAASIWGARSANGVIVVTTKSGKAVQKGTVKVSINSFVKQARQYDLDYLLNKSSSADQVEFERSTYGKRWAFGRVSDYNFGVVSSYQTHGTVALNENALGYLSDSERDAILNKLATQDNKQQIKDHLLENPFTHQHNLNIAAASNIFNNNLSIMYEGNQSYLKGNEKETVMINYRTTANIFKWLSFGFNGMYRQRWSTNNGSLSDLQTLAPYDMLVDDNGNRLRVPKTIYFPNLERYFPMENFPYPDLSYNPITEMESRDFRTSETQSRFQYELDIKPFDGLVIRSQAQYENFAIANKNIMGDGMFQTRYEIDLWTGWDRTANTFTPNIPSGDMLDQNSSDITTWNFRNQINFDKTFDKHAINAVGGMEFRSRITQSKTEPRAYGYNDETLSVQRLPNGFGSYTNPNQRILSWYGYSTTIYTNTQHAFTHYTDKYVSAFFNAAYTYDNKYTLSASARTDASNLITDDPSYRYSPFWSVGAGWQISKESFMEGVNGVDRLALRATYGYNGNVDRSTSFMPLINMYPTNNIYTNEPYAAISSYGNPTLRWEKTGTLDIGIDYSLWNGKMFGKIDYYDKKSKDLIAGVSIPSVNGVSSQMMNVANMVNRGIEVEVGTRLPLDGNNLVLYGNVNLSYNMNKITELYKASFTHNDLLPWNTYYELVTTYVEGENSSTMYGANYVGLVNDGTEASPNMQPKIEGKDGTLYGFGTWPADDVMNYAYKQGVTVAPWVAGLSAGLKIHDFDVSFIMTGKFGHVFRRTSFNYNYYLPNQLLGEVLNGNPAEILPLPQNDNESRYYFWDRFWRSFSYLTESANHIRMQEINLTYNLPAKHLSKTGLGSVKVYAQANNLFAIYANDYKEDPEFPLGTFKPTPTFTYGINVTF